MHNHQNGEGVQKLLNKTDFCKSSKHVNTVTAKQFVILTLFLIWLINFACLASRINPVVFEIITFEVRS